MSDLNCFNITARLTKDAVRKVFPSGKPYLTFDVANNTGHGEYATVNYFKCMIADKRADTLGQYLVKGKLVALNGELTANNWTNNEGKVIKDWQLKVQSVVLLGGGDKKPQEEFKFEQEEKDVF